MKRYEFSRTHTDGTVYQNVVSFPDWMEKTEEEILAIQDGMFQSWVRAINMRYWTEEEKIAQAEKEAKELEEALEAERLDAIKAAELDNQNNIK